MKNEYERIENDMKTQIPSQKTFTHLIGSFTKQKEVKRSSNCPNAISGSVKLRLKLWGKGRGQREDSNGLGIREIGGENGRNRSLNGVWPELRREILLTRGERRERKKRAGEKMRKK